MAGAAGESVAGYVAVAGGGNNDGTDGMGVLSIWSEATHSLSYSMELELIIMWSVSRVCEKKQTQQP
jgi:hypothetical protein